MNDTISNPTKRACYRGTTFWVVVGGLVMVSTFLAEYIDRLFLLQCLYRLDLRYWFPHVAHPLWLLVLLLALDAVMFRQPRTFAVKPGKWRLRFDTAIIAAKCYLVVLIVYLSINMCIPFRQHWFWWYPAHLFLFTIFLTRWSLIFKTRNKTDFTQEELNERKQFLMMSFTVTGELGIYNILFILFWADSLYHLYHSLWAWFGLGIYSHGAALAFLLICLALGVTVFVLKEWLAAIRLARKANPNESMNNPHQSEQHYDT